MHASLSPKAFAIMTGSDVSMIRISLFEQVFKGGPAAFLGRLFISWRSAPFWFEVIAIVCPIFVPNPFCLVFITFIVRTGIVMPAIVAAMQICIT